MVTGGSPMGLGGGAYPILLLHIFIIIEFKLAGILIAHQMLIQPVVVVYSVRLLLTTCLKQTCTMLQFDNCHCGFLV